MLVPIIFCHIYVFYLKIQSEPANSCTTFAYSKHTGWYDPCLCCSMHKVGTVCATHCPTGKRHFMKKISSKLVLNQWFLSFECFKLLTHATHAEALGTGTLGVTPCNKYEVFLNYSHIFLTYFHTFLTSRDSFWVFQIFSYLSRCTQLPWSRCHFSCFPDTVRSQTESHWTHSAPLKI